MTTGQKIRILRIDKGWTQEELGKRVGVQRAAINKYEKGTVVNIKRSTLEKLGEALGISPAELLDDDLDTSLSIRNLYESQLSPIEEDLIAGIKRLRKSYQYIVVDLVNDLLKVQAREDEARKQREEAL